MGIDSLHWMSLNTRIQQLLIHKLVLISLKRYDIEIVTMDNQQEIVAVEFRVRH